MAVFSGFPGSWCGFSGSWKFSKGFPGSWRFPLFFSWLLAVFSFSYLVPGVVFLAPIGFRWFFLVPGVVLLVPGNSQWFFLVIGVFQCFFLAIGGF